MWGRGGDRSQHSDGRPREGVAPRVLGSQCSPHSTSKGNPHADEGVEIFETADCEENIESQDRPKLEPFYVERYSWSQLKKLLADTRKYHGYMMAKAPHDFMFVKRNDPDGPHSDRIYYLGEYEVIVSERKCFLNSKSR